MVSTKWSAIVVFFLALPARSADLTLKQALDSARTYQFTRSGDTLIEAEAEANLARSNLLPNLSAAVTAQKDYLAQPGQSAETNGSIILKQDVINAANWATWGARKLSEAASLCDKEQTLLENSKTVLSTFFLALTAMDEEKLQKKQAERTEKVVALLRETSKLKLSSTTDYYSAAAEAAQIELQMTQATFDRTNALNLLRGQLGLSPQEPLNLDSNYLKEESVDLSNWTKWPENVPSVVSLKTRAQAAARDYSAAGYQALPTVSVSMVYGHPIGGSPSADNSLVALGTVSIPLFDQGTRSNERAKARRLQLLYENQLSEKRNLVFNEISTLLAQREADKKALEPAQRQVDLSGKALSGAWTLLSLGKKDYLTIKNAEDSVRGAERTLSVIRRRIDSTNSTIQLYFQAVKKANSNLSSACRIPAEY